MAQAEHGRDSSGVEDGLGVSGAVGWAVVEWGRVPVGRLVGVLVWVEGLLGLTVLFMRPLILALGLGEMLAVPVTLALLLLLLVKLTLGVTDALPVGLVLLLPLILALGLGEMVAVPVTLALLLLLLLKLTLGVTDTETVEVPD